MALELRQQLKLTQQLVMTPQLQQAIKLLQLSRLELVATVQQEIEQNPILEELGPTTESDETEKTGIQDARNEEPAGAPEKTAEVSLDSNASLNEINWQDYANEYESPPSFKPREDSDFPSRLDILSTKPDLQAHLNWQLSFTDLTDEEKEVGQLVIGNLDNDGYLKASEEEIIRESGRDPETVSRAIAEVQNMDPAGVAGRDVRECLLLQLKRLYLADSLASHIVRHHLGKLEIKNYKAIARATGRGLEEVLAAVRIIIDLDPYPGRAYSTDEPHYITPDVYVYKMDNEYVIMLNDDGLPRLKVSAYYRNILKNESPAPDSTRNYIQEKLKSATWLIKSIQQRQRTIYRVVESLVKFQKKFLEKGVGSLKPLILRDVAEDIGMHESTISRVTSNKYVHTPQGTFELKYFFNSSIEQKGGDSLSSESIKQRMRSIIQNENTEKPLSDNAIAEIFNQEKIKLARRTVAKYREQLGILPSKLRKQPKLSIS